MVYSELMQGFLKKMDSCKEAQNELDRALASMEGQLDAYIQTVEAVHSRLNAPAPQAAIDASGTVAAKPNLSEEDFKARLERLLEGSLENLGDKISQKIVNQIKDLKGLVGPDRDTKIRQIKEYADYESVDFSAVFQDKIESNIDEIGVEEQEAKGVDKSLEKLRKMKEKKK